MPIIANVGRKSPKMVALTIFIYMVLFVGAATTVYPFLIMLGSSVTSLTDFNSYKIVPRYLYNDDALMVKYLQDKNRMENFARLKMRYQVEEPYKETIDEETFERTYGQYSLMEPVMPRFDTADPAFKTRVADWQEFVGALPSRYKDTWFHYPLQIGSVQQRFQEFVEKKYVDKLAMQKAYAEVGATFVSLYEPFEAYDRHTWYPDDSPKMKDWIQFRETLPTYMFEAVTVAPLYQKYLQDLYRTKVSELNTAWGADYGYFWQVPFPTARPAGRAGEDWETFVRKKMPMRFMRIDPAKAQGAYLAHLREKYKDVKAYNGLMEKNAPSLEGIRVAEVMPETSLDFLDWQEFYEKKCPLDALVFDTADARWEAFLQAKYKDIPAMNAARGTEFASWSDAQPPWKEADYTDLVARKSEIKRDFLTRNYLFVIKQVYLQGRPIFNTLILILLSVGTAVTINPLAAYALSRYRLSYAAGVLIFLLATMAFPAEVAAIPNFLMIRELGLLNSFAALILPGLANGYSIFLLKGFFDSLPQELYEAASIDGASEFRMFWMITMPLSLPILSVIALFSFSSAYGSFMWAFTVCQDSKMWTLMVFLQQFQQGMPSHGYVVMASLVLAAIPTVIVFLSAQKILMKGIVVPTMK